MVPIHGKPLLGYWLELLLPDHMERVLINTHYLPNAVRRYVAGFRWSERIELIHEDVLLGTAGTILKNRRFLEGGAFLVAHADNLTRFDVDAFIATHENRPSGVEITMMTFESDSPSSCGIVERDDCGRVVAFHEKVENPPGNLANAAVYIMEPSIIAFIASLGSSVVDLSTEVLPHYLGRMHCFHNRNYHRDIGTPESLRIAETEFRP